MSSNVIPFPAPRRAVTKSEALRILCDAGVLRLYSSMDDLPDVDRTSGYVFKLTELVGAIPAA